MEDEGQVEEIVSVSGRLGPGLVLHHQTTLGGSLAPLQVGRVAACSVKYSFRVPRFLQEIKLRKDNIYFWISKQIFLLTSDSP